MSTTFPVKITKQYSIADYEDITNAGFICNLSQETLDIISKLSEQVGAPTYIKTPIFLKKEGRPPIVLGGIAGTGGGLAYGFLSPITVPLTIKVLLEKDN